MFGILNSVLKTAVAVVATPVALVADIVTLPASADDPQRGPFDRTESMLDDAWDNLKNITKP